MVLLILAAVVRIPFVLLPPVLSDDVWRHRWDGRVAAAGLDPYRFAPADLADTPLADRDFAKINHPDVPTVYGPFAQGLLALLALSPTGAAPWAIKATVAAFDLLSVGCLYALGDSIGVGPLAALVWAVHPLAVFETAGEGHLDGIAVSLLLAALALLVRARTRWAAALFAVAALVKITPLAASPAFLRTAGRRATLVFAAVFVLAHAPFFGSGAELRGLGTYVRSWEGNSVVYPELVFLLRKGDVAAKLKGVYSALKATFWHARVFDYGWGFFAAEYVARAALLVTLCLWVAFILRKQSGEPVRAVGLSLVALLTLSPTLHPWYLLNVLPFALLFRWTSVAWVAGAAPLAYLTTLPRGAPVFPHPGIVRAIEFTPALLLLVLCDLRKEGGGESA
jgi:hypothetical protein